MRQTVDILDTTLRDGAQGEGIQFSNVDKKEIVKLLDGLGIAYIEAGNPASNPKDAAFFEQAKTLTLRHARLVAFGSTVRRGMAPEDDEGCRALLAAGTRCVTVFGKAWSLHADEVLRVSRGENLRMIEDTVRYFTDAGRTVFFDAEHFFDGYTGDPDYALAVLDAAARGGAACLVLCDTNGGSFPDDVGHAAALVMNLHPHVGIHCHNDNGCAVASTLAAVKAGVRHVQGTYTGFGERCGNAALTSILPNLQGKLGYRCLPEGNLARLTETARAISEIANVTPDPSAPFVGNSAFAHKGGMHIDGVSKLARSFEHVEPASVGNRRRFLMSEAAGRGAVLPLLQKYRPDINKDSPEAGELVTLLKQKEAQGYAYESAEASLELLVRRCAGREHSFFELMRYRIMGEQDNLCSALVKLRVGGREELAAEEGDGPVHALDRALRKGLEVFYPGLEKVRLIDYKVRVLDSKEATAAGVRVLIHSTDGADIWSTVGVSTNIIDASWMALADSMEYKLLKG